MQIKRWTAQLHNGNIVVKHKDKLKKIIPLETFSELLDESFPEELRDLVKTKPDLWVDFLEQMKVG